MVNLRKTKLPKKIQIYLGIVIIILILLTVFNIAARFGKTGFDLSCKTGEIIKASIPRPPLMCTACNDKCSGTVIASENGQIICQGNDFETSGGTPTAVFVSCEGLKPYLGHNITVQSTVNSSFGYYEKSWSGIIG